MRQLLHFVWLHVRHLYPRWRHLKRKQHLDMLKALLGAINGHLDSADWSAVRKFASFRHHAAVLPVRMECSTLDDLGLGFRDLGC